MRACLALLLCSSCAISHMDVASKECTASGWGLRWFSESMVTATDVCGGSATLSSKPDANSIQVSAQALGQLLGAAAAMAAKTAVGVP